MYSIRFNEIFEQKRIDDFSFRYADSTDKLRSEIRAKKLITYSNFQKNIWLSNNTRDIDQLETTNRLHTTMRTYKCIKFEIGICCDHQNKWSVVRTQTICRKWPIIHKLSKNNLITMAKHSIGKLWENCHKDPQPDLFMLMRCTIPAWYKQSDFVLFEIVTQFEWKMKRTWNNGTDRIEICRCSFKKRVK